MAIEEELKRHYDESKRIINEAQRDGQLVLFVGAGASISSGMPSWYKVVKEIAIRLGINEVNVDDYLRIPQYYYNSRDKKEYTQLIQELFFYQKYLQTKPVHDLIIKFNTQTIITTNYDHLIEQAAERNSEMIRVVSKDADLPYRRGGRELIKMHGDFENDNFVLKEDDYISYSRNFKLIENYIKSIIGTKVVLFIGYSFNDPDVKHIFSWTKDILHGDFQPAYLINTRDDFDIDVEKYYKKWGINVLYSSIQLDDEHKKKDETGRLESMLSWLLDKGRKTKLEELYDRLRIFRDFNYAYDSRIESEFRNIGFRVDYGYIAFDTFPGHQFKKINDFELLEHIVKAIAYERFIQKKEDVYVRSDNGEKERYAIEEVYKAPDEEIEIIRGLLNILNKSGIEGMIFFAKIDETHKTLNHEETFWGNYSRVFVDFEKEKEVPKWPDLVFKFNDKELREVLKSNTKRLNESTPELYMEQASIYSYFEEYFAAYNCLKTAASLYYKRGERVKYFIAETDRYYIGKIINDNGLFWGLSEIDIEEVKKEIDVIDL